MRKHIATIHEPVTDVVACTLGPGDGAGRLEEWTAARESWLREAHEIADGVRLRFDPEAAETIADLAAREAGCCGFLRISVDRGGDAVVVDITGNADAEVVISALAGLPPK